MEFTDDEDDHLEEEEEDDDDEGITIPTPNPTTAPTPIRNGAGAAAGGTHTTTTTRYRECQKNHAVSIGGHAVDGCGEFMPAGEEGSLDALKCAACGCHRNFHRRESDIYTSPDLGAGPASSSGAALHHPHQLFPPPYYHRTPVPPPQQQHGYGLHHHHHMQQHYSPHHQRPLALPSSSGGRTEEMEELSNPSSSGGGRSGSRSKRFRTKFTAEQKERMAEFAERIGWRIQKQDEAAVQQFCQEVNVTRQVLKVWLHNNKHSLARKP